MKNLVIIVTYLFISVSLFSQESFKSGEVIYTVKTNLTQDSENSPFFNKFKKKLNRFSEKLSYTLKFNKNESIFNLNSDLVFDGEDEFTQLAITINKGESVFFIDKKQKIIIEQKPFLGDDFLIQSSTLDLKWELINEKKKIGQYICYKAILKIRDKGSLKEQSSTYIAWYSPDIPFNYGPFKFNSLPGLILELFTKNQIFIASTIKLKKETIKILKPSKGKLITNEEYENIGKKAFKNR